MDRAISLKKDDATIEMVLKVADALIAYAYQGDEDFADACKRMTECLKEMPAQEARDLVASVIHELQFIDEQIGAQLNRIQPIKEAANAH